MATAPTVVWKTLKGSCSPTWSQGVLWAWAMVITYSSEAKRQFISCHWKSLRNWNVCCVLEDFHNLQSYWMSRGKTVLCHGALYCSLKKCSMVQKVSVLLKVFSVRIKVTDRIRLHNIMDVILYSYNRVTMFCSTTIMGKYLFICWINNILLMFTNMCALRWTHKRFPNVSCIICFHWEGNTMA